MLDQGIQRVLPNRKQQYITISEGYITPNSALTLGNTAARKETLLMEKPMEL